MPQQLSHCRSSIRKVAAPSMQLHHCDSSCLAGSQHNLQQGLRAADGATQEQQPWAAMVGGCRGHRAEGISRGVECRDGCSTAGASCGRTADCYSKATSSAGVKPLLSVTPVTGSRGPETLRHTATSPLLSSAVWSAGTSHARAGGCLLPFTGRLSHCQCHLITIQGQPSHSPLQNAQCPSAKDVCSPYQAAPILTSPSWLKVLA